MARELILQLGKKLTDPATVKLGLEKLDENSPEYYGLAAVVTDEMAEVALAMDVRAEASCCLGCGVSIVDQNKCIGCGLCIIKCEFDAPTDTRLAGEAYRFFNGALAPYLYDDHGITIRSYRLNHKSAASRKIKQNLNLRTNVVRRFVFVLI